VERNVDAMLQGMLEGFMRRGIDPRQLGLNLDRCATSCVSVRCSKVKGYLLLEAIAEKEKIEASEEDLAKHFDKLAGELSSRRRKFRRGVQAAGVPRQPEGPPAAGQSARLLLSKANFQ